ncbi:MAG: hypothetical protein F6K41_11510 [Symploca sp. SIO3E6]|nr:hypothetical protein [Caldora sp. SIO3E6]
MLFVIGHWSLVICIGASGKYLTPIGDKLRSRCRCQGRRGDAGTRGRGDEEEKPQFF